MGNRMFMYPEKRQNTDLTEPSVISIKTEKKKRVTGKTLTINDISYRFDAMGNLEQGLQEIDGSYYYFKDGRIRTNYYKKSGKYGYYFGEDGKAVKSTWVTIKNTDRYFQRRLPQYKNVLCTGLQRCG